MSWNQLSALVTIVAAATGAVFFVLYAIRRHERLFNVASTFLLIGIGALTISQYLSTDQLPLALILMFVAYVIAVLMRFKRRKKI